ncbi:hypothetical protein LEMLEM_LOCUS12084 [Lemmus lemmus]
MRRGGPRPDWSGYLTRGLPAPDNSRVKLFAMETLSVTGNPSPGGRGCSPLAGSADRSLRLCTSERAAETGAPGTPRAWEVERGRAGARDGGD